MEHAIINLLRADCFLSGSLVCIYLVKKMGRRLFKVLADPQVPRVASTLLIHSIYEMSIVLIKCTIAYLESNTF